MEEGKRPAVFMIAVLLVLLGMFHSSGVAGNGSFTDNKGNENETQIILTGDIMLGRRIGDKIDNHGANFPFENTREILERGDITFGNLECVISTNGTPAEGRKWTFRAPPECVDGLLWAGYDVVSLANNHVLDYGPVSINDTMAILNHSEINYTGLWMRGDIENDPIPRLQVFLRNGIRFGFLAYSDRIPTGYGATTDRAGPAPADLDLIETDIAYARDRADVLLVSVHWGTGTYYVKTPIEKQINISRAIIDAGADVVIGHGPHVLQDMEAYNGKLIIYSLGNFVFDSSNPECQRTFIVTVTMKGEEIETLKLTPTKRIDYQSTPLNKGIEYEFNDTFHLSWEDFDTVFNKSADPAKNEENELPVIWIIAGIVIICTWIVFVYCLSKRREGHKG